MDESPRRWRLLFGHYLGDIILGANDGIITTFAVVAGVAGAQLPGSIVIILATKVGLGPQGRFLLLAALVAGVITWLRIPSKEAH